MVSVEEVVIMSSLKSPIHISYNIPAVKNSLTEKNSNKIRNESGAYQKLFLRIHVTPSTKIAPMYVRELVCYI